MASTTILSAVILVTTLIAAVVFAVVAQNMRYIYLQQLSSKVARTQEAVSVNVWKSETTIIAEVQNIGSTGVNIRALEFVVGYVVTVKIGQSANDYLLSYTKIYNDIYLSPGRVKYLVFDLRKEKIQLPAPPQYISSISIRYIRAMVSTDNNVYVFNPAPPMDAVVLEIQRDDIGKGFQVVLPNGKIAQIRVYEYLFCSLGYGSRLTNPPSQLAQTTYLLIAYAPDFKSVQRGFYRYAYDYKNKTFPSITIDVKPLELKNLTDNTAINLTTCMIEARGYSLGGYELTISRGILILGTQLSGYDIVAVMFAETPYPVYVDRSQVNNPEPGMDVFASKNISSAYVVKIPLPDKDIDVMDFMGTQATSAIYPGIVSNQFVLSIGNYYSQAVLVGQVVNLQLGGSGSAFTAYAKFYDPYPLYIVITTPATTST